MLKINKFYFQPHRYVLPLNSTYVFLDRYRYQMQHGIRDMGTDAQISCQEILTIFGHYVRLEKGNLKLHGPAGSLHIPNSGLEQFTSLSDAASTLFGLHWRQEHDFFVLDLKQNGSMSCQDAAFYRLHMRKKQGELFELFWNQEVQRLIPYRMYVPSGAVKPTPLPLLIVLHGGGSTPDEIFSLSNHRISALAESRQFFVLAADGCIRNSSYGCPYPPAGLHPSDQEIFGSSEQQQWERSVSERALTEVIRLVKEQYLIDDHSLFLAGNSMGGMGTFYYAARNPTMFRAIAPAGAAPDPEQFDPVPLCGLPILFIAGTEDHHGYDHLLNAYNTFQNRGLSIKLRTVGGGAHSTAWIDILDEWVEFLFNQRHR